MAAAGAAHVQPPCAGDGRGKLNRFPVENIVTSEVEAPNANFISNYSTVKVFVHPKRRWYQLSFQCCYRLRAVRLHESN